MAHEGTREVEAAARALLVATTVPDADAIEAMLAPGYTYAHASNARVDSRQEWVESFHSGGQRYHVYDIFDLAFLDYDEVVVIRGRAHQEMSPRGERIALHTRFTSVWVRRDGRWLAVAWHATRIEE